MNTTTDKTQHLEDILGQSHKTPSKKSNAKPKQAKPQTETMFSEAAEVFLKLADEMSEDSSDDLADLTMALTIKKAAQKLNSGKYGTLTTRMMASMKSGFISPVKARVLQLEAEEEDLDKDFLLPASTPYNTSSTNNNSDTKSQN